MTDLVEALRQHEMPPLAHDAADEIDSLRASNAELLEALETIAGGHTTKFPNGPDVMNPGFRQKMWSWSQVVARAAIERATK